MSMPVDSELVTIRTFSSEPEAMVAKAALQAFGIDCTTGADDCGHLRPSLTMANGIRLIVRSGDAAQAAEVLNNVPESAGSVQS
jgi:hypothetical protein